LACDTDNSGFLDRNELAGVGAALGHLMDEAEADAMMAAVDLNKDGKCSLEEF